MAEAYNHDYLFSVTDKDIITVLYNVGIAHGCCDQETEHIGVQYEPAFTFLEQAGLVQEESYALSNIGKDLFELLFIFADVEAANDRIEQILLQNPVVNLLCQSFYGRGKVGVEQLRVLLNYHGVGSKEIGYSSAVSLLGLLNKYGVVIYDKKNKVFTVKKTGGFIEPISQHFICPTHRTATLIVCAELSAPAVGTYSGLTSIFEKKALKCLLMDYLVRA